MGELQSSWLKRYLNFFEAPNASGREKLSYTCWISPGDFGNGDGCCVAGMSVDSVGKTLKHGSGEGGHGYSESQIDMLFILIYEKLKIQNSGYLNSGLLLFMDHFSHGVSPPEDGGLGFIIGRLW